MLATFVTLYKTAFRQMGLSVRKYFVSFIQQSVHGEIEVMLSPICPIFCIFFVLCHSVMTDNKQVCHCH